MVWRATDSPLAVPVAVATGVLIDSDHVTDVFGPEFMGPRPHMVRFFHAWEYTAAGLIALGFWYHPILLAATLGHLSHMVLDQVTNEVRPLAYLLVYRIRHRFARSELGRKWSEESLLRRRSPTPLWGRIEPTGWRLYLYYKQRRSGRERDSA